MNTDTAKKEVLNWVENGCDYDQGTLLYSKYGKNQMLKRIFPGKAITYSGKLVYELCKSVGINSNGLKPGKKIVAVAHDEPAKQFPKKPAPVQQASRKSNTDRSSCGFQIASLPEMPETIPVKNIGDYPPIMRRVITEYAEMFQERSKTHRIMTEMPDGNSQALKAKRQELFNLVKWYTGRLELFWEARNLFEKNGTIPTEDQLWPKPKENAKAELPDDPIVLKKMKKNAQSANVKDQNMLDFQTEKKGTKPAPMPAGPKRMRIENRIKGRLKLIEEIEYKLIKL